MKEIHVDLDELVGEDTTSEERRLIMKRRHIVVYNRDRVKLDLRDIDEKVNAVRKKIGDMGELKKSLGKLKSFVKFTKIRVIMNEKRINTLKELKGRFMIITNTDLPVREVVNAYKDQWRIE
jgi:intergrase/recombinase